MAVSIWCERDAAVVEPERDFAFDLLVRDQAGTPAASVTLSLSIGRNRSVALSSSTTVTDRQGRARLALRSGASPEEVAVYAEIGEVRWRGTLYVTRLHVTAARDVHLSPVDEELLRMLFWDKRDLRVLREFGGGLSGNRVLQVQAFDTSGGFLTQVAKLGVRDEIRQEGSNYELFRNRLPNAAPVAGCVETGTKAAILYGDAGATRSLEPVVPLAKYFADHDSDELHASLCAVLDEGMRRVYRRFSVRASTYGELLGTFLPEHLVVSLDGGLGTCGVYPRGQLPDVAAEAPRLSPRDVEHGRAHAGRKQGEVLVLTGFRIGKMQEGDLNLEDDERRRYKIKVRYEGAPVAGVATGERVDVVARFLTDRDTRMQFAVHDCLEQHGMTRQDERFVLEDEVYPHPLALLPTVLDGQADFACAPIHGDLHWDNVMLEGPQNWWLIDYGLTRKEGPVLFDFVKLELYLRTTQLAKLRDLTPQRMLAFERDLVDNPMGQLPGPGHGHADLDKAAQAIRTIRRLAQRYCLDGYLEYLRLLFVYALASTKYYPAPDRWNAARGDSVRLAALQKSGRQLFFALAPALAIGRVLRWEELRERRPSLNFGFVPMGAAVEPQPDAVMLDVGNRSEPGVIDHHQVREGEPECTTSLVWKHPELVTEHLAGKNPNDVRWVVHEWPDFDCVAATYLAWHRATLGFFPPGAASLQRYAFDVDAGADFLETVPFPERTPYALFALHLHEFDVLDASKAADARRMRHGFKVMDYLCHHEAAGAHLLAANRVPHEHGFWRATMGHDQGVYEQHDRLLGQEFEAAIRRDARVERVKGLTLRSPRSLFFKGWARNGGYLLLVVLWPQPEKPDPLIIVSVPTDHPYALKGLGQALEAAERVARERLRKRRPTDQPRWQDVDNNDPWYDGRSPIHQYTIVASPRMGTVLSVEEVVRILEQGAWLQQAGEHPDGSTGTPRMTK